MSDSGWRIWSSWVHGGSSFVAFVCNIAILVAITTIVRRHRPDAYQGLQAWAIGTLVAFVVTNVAWACLPTFSGRTDGMEGYFRMNALLTIVGSAIHIGLVIVLIRGLTALAQPPKPVVIEGAPPYR